MTVGLGRYLGERIDMCFKKMTEKVIFLPTPISWPRMQALALVTMSLPFLVDVAIHAENFLLP